MDKVGIRHCGLGPDPFDKNTPLTQFVKDPEVGAVIVAYDEHFSYPKMLKAATYLANEKIHFIGTNTDESFPMRSKDIVAPGD